MRTLVISDLHIGARNGRSRLDDDQVVSTLAAAIAEVDHLVLLGDVVELRQNPMRDALAAASRVLPRLVAGLGPGKEVTLVTGNHDHELFGSWEVRRGATAPPPPMSPETAVDWRDGEPLAALAGMLGQSGATVRGAYPGVLLRDDVYATHGHYLDCHTTAPGFERLLAGWNSKMLKLPGDQMRSVDDYERVLSPIYAWMLALSERGGPELDGAEGGVGSVKILRILNEGGLKGGALQVGVSALAKALQLAGLGELSGDVTGDALYLTELRGMGLALSNLGVDSHYVIFGHTHRAGPLPDDDASPWLAPTGSQMLNSGCWVHEGTAFLKPGDEFMSAYRPGFAIELDDSDPATPPRLVNLLDG